MATTLKPSFKASTAESCSELYDVKNISSRLGRWQSGHVMLGPFSQALYSTVLDEKFDNVLPFFFRRAAFNLAHINRIITVLQ